MANVLEGRRWTIDTVNTGAVHAANIKVKSIRWVDAGAGAADAVVVDDPVTDTVLWEGVATGVNNSEAQLIEQWWPNGFGVPTLAAGGTLYIELM